MPSIPTGFPHVCSGEFTTVTDAGLVGKPLTARRTADRVELSGSFGVFFPGELKAFLYDEGGVGATEVPCRPFAPRIRSYFIRRLQRPENIARVSIHLIDNNGVDRGALGEVFVTINDEGH